MPRGAKLVLALSHVDTNVALGSASVSLDTLREDAQITLPIVPVRPMDYTELVSTTSPGNLLVSMVDSKESPWLHLKLTLSWQAPTGTVLVQVGLQVDSLGPTFLDCALLPAAPAGSRLDALKQHMASAPPASIDLIQGKGECFAPLHMVRHPSLLSTRSACNARILRTARKPYVGVSPNGGSIAARRIP
jgi:hypothetical protein